MKSFLKEYVTKYNRIVIISDHKSYIASDVIYENIVETMQGIAEIKNDRFHTYDEFDTENFSINHGVPRRTVFDNIIKKVKGNDILVMRCAYYNRINPSSMNGNIIQSSPVPVQVGYNAELIIGTVNNKLTIVKDRYGLGTNPKYDDYDLRNIGKSYKLNKILKRISS